MVSASPPAPPASPFVPVVPAGGAGTRLWPLSRRSRPKFLLDLTGSGRSLLQQTLDRLTPLGSRPPIVVTGAAHASEVRAQVGEGVRVLAEPAPRNSMPAIALAAALALRADEDAVIGSFAADHLISDQAAFARAVMSARAAAEHDYLVTIGIEPTHPATGFGYIEEGPTPAALEGTGAVGVARFVEKPEPERAEAFVRTGRFRWNAGMFVMRARRLLEALDARLPPLGAGARELAAALGTEGETAVFERLWPTLTAIAIDHALAEPLSLTGGVAMVPADFGWDDVGDFAALARQLRERAGPADQQVDGSDVVSLGGAETIAIGARATVYGSARRPVALVGVDGISVVDAEDVLLVLAEERAQDLAQMGPLLDAQGLGALR